MNWRILLVGIVVSISGAASADPATHAFVISSAQSGTGDCGGGSCAKNCRLEGKITNISSHDMPSATLIFRYPHPGLDAGTLASIGFDIPVLQAGKSATLVQWINGLRCNEVDVRSVSAKCDTPSCPYGAIRIPQTAVPRIKAAKIDIDR